MMPSPPQPKRTPWTCGNIIGVAGLALTILSITLALTQPEVRRFIGLDHSLSPTQQVTSTPQASSTSKASSTATVAGGITGTWRGEGVGSSYVDTLFLTQTGDSITGTGNAYYTSSPTVTFSETINGSISGNSVRLTEHVNELHCFRAYALTLSQDGQSLNGSYVGCGVDVDKVTIQLAKQ